MKHFLLILLLIFPSVILPQHFKIAISGSESKKALIYSIQGEDISLVDSVISADKKTYKYTFNSRDHHAGLYRFQLRNDRWVDFIYDNDEINLKTDAGNFVDSMQVISSESNRLYYSFIKLNRLFKIKTDLLQLILARYPKDDDYYSTTKKKLLQLQEDYLNFVNVLSQNHPRSFIAQYIRTSQIPVLDNTQGSGGQLLYLKAHALDNVDFNNTRLINSDAFTNKTIEYLSYYRNPQLNKQMLEHEFILAVDSVLNKAKVNLAVYQHIVEYLIDGFRKFSMDEVLDYIVNNYVIKDDLCLDSKTESNIERRISQNRKLPVSSLAPEITAPDSSGIVMRRLSEIKADRTVLIFYSSWCPHCKALVPKIADLYKQQKHKQFEVFAVSLDTIKGDWLNFIRNYDLNWINVSELNGWKSKAAGDYYIYATPTIFVLNKEREIISKPLTIDELKKSL